MRRATERVLPAGKLDRILAGLVRNIAGVSCFALHAESVTALEPGGR